MLSKFPNIYINTTNSIDVPENTAQMENETTKEK